MSNVTRKITVNGNKIDVELEVNHDNGTYYVIDEIYPPGMTVEAVSNSGSYKADPGHIKWLKISGAKSMTYRYTLNAGTTTNNIFAGVYMFEGDKFENPILGVTAMVKSENDVDMGDLLAQRVMWYKYHNAGNVDIALMRIACSPDPVESDDINDIRNTYAKLYFEEMRDAGITVMPPSKIGLVPGMPGVDGVRMIHSQRDGLSQGMIVDLNRAVMLTRMKFEAMHDPMDVYNI